MSEVKLTPIPSLAELRALAEEMGVKEVAKFVSEQQELARAERAAERDHLREFREHETAKMEHEAARMAHDAAENNARRAHERLMAENHTAADVTPPSSNVSMSSPRLPMLKDGEDISSYLIRFERIATLLEIPRDRWAIHLGSLLTGKALDIYIGAAEDDTRHYEGLKQVLIDGFQKTPDGYRLAFRSLKLGPDKTYQQFAIQLGRVLDRWLESMAVAHDFISMRNLFITDQFMASISSDVRTFIKEQQCRTLEDMCRSADAWATAQKSYPKSSAQKHSSKSANSPNFLDNNPNSVHSFS